MALSSVTIVTINKPHTATIQISSTANTQSIGSIAKEEIYRKVYGTNGLGTKILSKTISSVSNLTFDFYDCTNQSGYKYTYTVVLVNSSSETLQSGTYTVESWFEGIFVGDYSTQYIIPLDCDTTRTRQKQGSYVTTLASRTPYMVSNSALNYNTGQSSGLYAPLDINNQPVIDKTGQYFEALIDFLSNGYEKILKTSDGGMWYVMIDPEISIESTDKYEGYRKLSFNWTEVGDIPMLRTAV